MRCSWQRTFLRALKAAHLALFGTLRASNDGYLLHYFDSVRVEPHNLARMVSQQPDRRKPQVSQNLRSDPRFMLRCRGLVMVPVSEAGLVQINENANALFGDPIERSVNHFAAIAASRSENIAERTSRVHAHQNIFLLSDIAANKREMTLIIDSAHILNRLKNSRIGLETPFAAALD